VFAIDGSERQKQRQSAPKADFVDNGCFACEGRLAMWCKQCQQDVRAIMLPTEMGHGPHCPRCGDLLRLAAPLPQPMIEMADATGDFVFASRTLPISLVSNAASGDFADGASITIAAPRTRRRADISIDWQWDEDRRALRRINAALEGGAMYRFDRAHLVTAIASDAPQPEQPTAHASAANTGNPIAGGLLFVGLAALSAGAAFFAHSLFSGASAMSGLTMPLLFGGQTLITFSLLFQMDGLRRARGN
jgi:hypothetical protein